MVTLKHIFVFSFLLSQFCFAQWFQQNSGTTANLNAVYFADANIGWAVGDSGKILHTTNSGQNWILQMSGTIENLNDITFDGLGEGIIVGNAGTILRTTNAGLNWIQINAGVVCPLWSVSFIDDHTGWVAGGFLGQYCTNGIILKTDNGGNIWNIIDTLGYSFIHFIDGSIGWRIKMVLFADQQLQKTTDGGVNWNTQTHYRMFGTPCFLNENIGWATAMDVIIKTIDGGVNWFLQDSTTWANAVFFIDQNNGWAIDYYKIKNSSDGGTNWGVQLDSFPHALTECHFSDINNGWVVGEGGTILHTTNGGVSFIEEEKIDEIPSEFLLSQNYPNPFNPSTKIKYSIPSVTLRQAQSDILVTLKVFDILGNEIEKLVSEEKPAGTYEVTWYSENLPSGIYFYQMRAGDYTAVKKMILLR